MDNRVESSNFNLLPNTTLRNLSSSSSAFYSANQSPFFSPRSPTCQVPAVPSTSNISSSVDQVKVKTEIKSSKSTISSQLNMSELCEKLDNVSPSTGISNSTVSSSNRHGHENDNYYPGDIEKKKKLGKNYDYAPCSASLSSNRIRNCDVFIGLHGKKRSLLRFTNWLRSELEVQGVSCFVSDRARCRNSKQRSIVERAMDVSTFGVVILTKKSFKNLYTMEEIRFFLSKKNLVPIFFDLGPGDCLVRDIVEKRGEMWDEHGGELWHVYRGSEKEWKDAVNGLLRIEEWKLEAHEGNWRDCIFRAVTLLASRLGRRSVVERLTKWKEKTEREEFPFPRNENFIGRKKELSEMEIIIFGDITGESEKDYFELKAAKPRRKSVTINWGRNNSFDERNGKGKNGKGKEPVEWKESEKDIEMQSLELSSFSRRTPRSKHGGRYSRRKRSSKILYGKGIACVSGESGIGKTELLLEFAYRFHQRYKMVLWIGGESRYIRQNYLNLFSFLEVDIGMENSLEKGRIKSFEEQEESAISRIRKELMRNIPFLVVIDNLESEKDWWDHKLVMDLLPRFGGEIHFIISTNLNRVMNLESLKLSYLSGVEAMSLMRGTVPREYSVTEVDALRVIEDKLGRLTLGLAIVGSILSELPINPSRLLDTVNRMPLREFSYSGRNGNPMRRNTFLFQLFEVCFSIFDHADGPRSLATRMVMAAGWFAPSAIPISILGLAAHRIPEKQRGTRLWKNVLRSLTCGCASSYSKKSENDASSMLLRFNMARSSTKEGYVCFNELIMTYARKRCVPGVAQAVVKSVISHGSVPAHSDHLWAACFLIFGFKNDPKVVELNVSDLLSMVKDVVLPLGIRTFITFSRCGPALDLLRLCTDVLEAADEAFVTPVDKWLDKSFCWQLPIQNNAQLNPYLWHELALSRATVLETRAKLMMRGAQFDVADDLIRKAIFIRSSICGEEHAETVSARETLSKITRLLANVQTHKSSP